MNAQKDFVESDEKFEAAWAQLQTECAAANVEIIDPEPVRSYLQAHLDMIEVTGKVCASARREFAEEPLTLNVYVDPEIDDRYLQVCVRFAGGNAALGQRLEAVTAPFDEELCRISGYILMNVRFVSKR